MYTVIDENDSFRKFDFSSIISRQDDKDACNIVRSIIYNGDYFENSPKFQTKENIFSRNEAVWLKYRMSFIFSCFMYLGREARIANMMAWSFMTNSDTEKNRDILWHHHWHPKQENSKMLSGVWYLNVPEDVKDINTCGTEMAPNGPEKDGKFFVKPEYGKWLIYPSNQWHRPGIVQSQQYRFILAADIEYF